MWTPDPSEVLAPGEPQERLFALYRDILVRTANDHENPTPIEESRAWEKTKVLWRVQRIGTDHRDVLEAYSAARAHERANAVTRAQGWRTDVVRSCVANLRALDEAYDQVERSLQRSSSRPNLELVGG